MWKVRTKIERKERYVYKALVQIGIVAPCARAGSKSGTLLNWRDIFVPSVCHSDSNGKTRGPEWMVES